MNLYRKSAWPVEAHPVRTYSTRVDEATEALLVKRQGSRDYLSDVVRQILWDGVRSQSSHPSTIKSGLVKISVVVDRELCAEIEDRRLPEEKDAPLVRRLLSYGLETQHG